MKTEKQLKKILRGTVEVIQEDELIQKLKEGRPLRIKLGVDPTSADIHLGHTVILKKLKDFQEVGHQVIFIIGDFTAQIGDPSGQVEARPRLSRKEVLKNARTYTRQIFRILAKNKTKIVFNSEWLAKMGVKEIMDLSSRWTVARILERDDFQKRYAEGKPISLLEFLYPLFQGYDSVKLKTDVEIGGTDQKFNLLVGRQLQKSYGQPEQVAITMPLLEGTDGKLKMSKSYENYIGIEEPPGEMFGKLMSIPDKLTFKYAELLTSLNLNELRQLPPRLAKTMLASEIVGQYHGQRKAKIAQEDFEKIFSRRELPARIPEMRILEPKIWILDLLVKIGFAANKTAARRLICQGGIKVDGEKITDENLDVEINKEMVIQLGRRNFKRLLPSKKK